MGFEVAVEAADYTAAGIVRALVEHAKRGLVNA